MTTIRQARSLDVMLAEVNHHAPSRSIASDGGLASTAHHLQNPTSDHEPNAAGVWRARDVTNDPAGGLDGADLARRVAAKLGKIPALGSGAYVIFNRRIISTDRLAAGWRPYDGVNPHTTHVHVSVATAAAGYDSMQPWRLWSTATPHLDQALRELRAARDARKPGPVRRRIKVAIATVRAIREAVRR